MPPCISRRRFARLSAFVFPMVICFVALNTLSSYAACFRPSLVRYITAWVGPCLWGVTLPGVVRRVGFYPIDSWKQKSDNDSVFVARQQQAGHR